jgi:hypothetical protein
MNVDEARQVVGTKQEIFFRLSRRRLILPGVAGRVKRSQFFGSTCGRGSYPRPELVLRLPLILNTNLQDLFQQAIITIKCLPSDVSVLRTIAHPRADGHGLICVLYAADTLSTNSR